MAREITISASTRPVCSSFFKIREQDSEYQSMEEFTYTHSEIDNSLLQNASLNIAIKMNSPMSNTLNGFMNL